MKQQQATKISGPSPARGRRFLRIEPGERIVQPVSAAPRGGDDERWRAWHQLVRPLERRHGDAGAARHVQPFARIGMTSPVAAVAVPVAYAAQSSISRRRRWNKSPLE